MNLQHLKNNFLNQSISHTRIFSLMLAPIATMGIMPVQFAQAESVNALEEVVVSARKRQETLQEVPVVVNVLTESAIERQRIEGIKDIATIVPGMYASKTISGTSGFIFLRGVGTGAGNPSFDQAVAINMDGMGVNSAQMLQAGMVDLKQIEVLKGPQALFYGKNSPGGVIAIHTNDPGDEFELEVTGMYETVANEKTLQGVISGPLSDTFGARLAFGYSEANDHWVDVVSGDRFETGPEGQIQTAFETDNIELETSYFLATLQWEPTDNFSAKLKLAHMEDNESGPVYAGIQKTYCAGSEPQSVTYPIAGVNGCEADDVAISPGLNPDLAWQLKDGQFVGESDNYFTNENNFAVLEMNYEMGNGLTLTSVTGYFDNEEDRLADASFEIASALITNQLTELEQWSQEIRLVSNYDGNVNFALGAFYEDKEFRQDNETIGGFIRYAPALVPIAGNLPFGLGRQAVHQEGTSYSAFAQVIWDINDQWTLAGGGRYSYEEKELSMRARLTGTPLFGYPDVPWVDVPIADPKNDWNNFSPEVTLSYQLNDDIMFFASYREGFKSGGYDSSFGAFRALGVVSGAPPLDVIYNEEAVDGFEVGMKSTLLDGSLRFNVTAYSYDYEDLQLARFDGGGGGISFSIFNAGKASIEGVEVETLWNTPVDGLVLTANISAGSSEFDEFLAPCWSGQTIALGCDSLRDPDTGNFTSTNKAGESLPFASDLSATFGLDYDIAVSSNWNAALNLTASYNDGYNPVPERPPESVLQDSYWWINAGATLYSTDDKWELFVRGNNLTDETTTSSGAAAPGLGDASLTGTDDSSGLPDFISYINGGMQISVGLTYRM